MRGCKLPYDRKQPDKLHSLRRQPISTCVTDEVTGVKSP